MTDDEIRHASIEFAKKNKKRIAEELTNPKVFIPENNPISIFMAGSPGAGKTELSTTLINNFEKGGKQHVVRIDTDAYRKLFPGYSGGNSYLFQKAASDIANRVYDLTIDRKQTFILDSTFSNYQKAVDNINRSLQHKRFVLVFYVYQKPEIAWDFTVKREIKEGRRIRKEDFINKFIGARDTVERIRETYNGRPVVVFLVKKHFVTHEVENIVNISMPGVTVDDYLPERYTEETLEEML